MGIQLSDGAEGGEGVCHDILGEFLSSESHPLSQISIKRDYGLALCRAVFILYPLNRFPSHHLTCF